MADPDQCDETRLKLHSILPRGASKLHWRQMDPRQKERATALISDLDIAHLVVIGQPMNPRKQERARAACLERLLWRLGELGVERVELEQRTPSLNARDRQLITRLRGRRSIPAELRVEIARPSEEPMLWIPDQVLGAVGDHHCDEGRWLSRYRGAVEQIAGWSSSRASSLRRARRPGPVSAGILASTSHPPAGGELVPVNRMSHDLSTLCQIFPHTFQESPSELRMCCC